MVIGTEINLALTWANTEVCTTLLVIHSVFRGQKGSRGSRYGKISAGRGSTPIDLPVICFICVVDPPQL